MKDTAGKRRKLKKQEVDRFITSINAEDMQNQTCNTALQVPTRVDLPLGELANPEMSVFIKDWAKTYTFTLGEITPQHQFNAQGIEGLVRIENVPFNMALLAARKIGIYRIEIFVPRRWTYFDIHNTLSSLSEAATSFLLRLPLPCQVRIDDV